MRLELTDVRGFRTALFEPDPRATTVVVGPNGAGKTTLLEAVAFLGTQRSFRVAARESMVRNGCTRALIRGGFEREGRPLEVDAELSDRGQTRTTVNHHPVRSRSELGSATSSTIFSPADLALVQGPPQFRRDLLDDALRATDRVAGAALDDLDRALRQRSALLRQARGRLSEEVAHSLDVWDERLATAGTVVTAARRQLLERVTPAAADRYSALAGEATATLAEYRPSWGSTLAVTLAERRDEDVRRAVCTAGPHRDEVQLCIAGRDARTQASQGEQRSLALSLRLAVHAFVTERSGSAPILLLDDVFSELDKDRGRALVELLPAAQCLLTTASVPPPGIDVARTVDVRDIGGPA